MKNTSQNSRVSDFLVFLLRVVIGWHFLYEGVAKLLDPDWTAAEYLRYSRWIFSDLFQWIVSDPDILGIVDLMNMWGLILIGLGLFLGCFIRLSALAGIVLLGLYYSAYPPFGGLDATVGGGQGNYLVVSMNLIEMVVLLFIAFYPSRGFLGFDGFIKLLSRKNRRQPADMTSKPVFRREFIKGMASVPLLGAFAAMVWKDEKRKKQDVHATTSATMKIDEVVKDVKGSLPVAKIGDVEISRLILGGNLIGGYAHARDLLYVGRLFRQYNTEWKIFQTLMLCERSGINTIIGVGWQMDVINKYNRLYNGSMKFIAMVNSTKAVDMAVDKGAVAIYIIGNHCDWQVRDGKVDELGVLLDYIRSKGFVAGLGAHSIQALVACDEAGIEPDFYVKTLHHDNYWSAHPEENRIPFSVDTKRSQDHDQFHDNMFCMFPDKTIEFMKDKQKPWIGFKVLAGGAIHPKDGFKYAFQNGADFICVGMFDFQIVEDVNITIQTLSQTQDRARPWQA